MPEGNPYPSFFVALFAHLVVMALIFILPPRTIEREPEQVVAINLTDMPALATPGAAGGPPPKPETKPVPQTKVEPPPEPTKIEAQPVKEKLPPPPKPPEKIEPKPVKEKPKPEVVKEPPPPPPKAISLTAQKIKKEAPEPPKKDDKEVKRKLDDIRNQLTKEERQREIDRLRRQLTQEEKRLEQRKRDKAIAEAEAAKDEADRLKSQLENYQAQSRVIAARDDGLLGYGPAQKNNQAGTASSGVDSALAEQYYARITGQLKSYWKLPDFKDWPPNLLTTVAVTIDKGGKILDVQFKKRSGDDAFDRLVRKALDDADPLPPIPPALKKERLAFTADYTPFSITGQ